MITIKDLLNDITVQGNIRVSAWTRNGEEKVILITERESGLVAGQLPKRWRNSEILYMFYPGDGFLHIELASED